MEGFLNMMSLLQPSKTLRDQEVSTRIENSSSGINSQNLNSRVKRVKVLQPRTKGPKQLPDNIKCDICGKIISFKRNIARHMLTFHNMTEEESFNCAMCNSSYNSQYHLERQIESKNCLRNLKFECKNCKKMFMSADKLSVHSVKNCDKKYMCSSCFCFFKSKRDYNNHISSHES